MEYRYFRHGDTNLDPTTRKPILVRVYGLYRVNDKEFTAEKYMGRINGNWTKAVMSLVPRYLVWNIGMNMMK